MPWLFGAADLIKRLAIETALDYRASQKISGFPANPGLGLFADVAQTLTTGQGDCRISEYAMTSRRPSTPASSLRPITNKSDFNSPARWEITLVTSPASTRIAACDPATFCIPSNVRSACARA